MSTFTISQVHRGTCVRGECCWPLATCAGLRAGDGRPVWSTCLHICTGLPPRGGGGGMSQVQTTKVLSLNKPQTENPQADLLQPSQSQTPGIKWSQQEKDGKQRSQANTLFLSPGRFLEHICQRYFNNSMLPTCRFSQVKLS